MVNTFSDDCLPCASCRVCSAHLSVAKCGLRNPHLSAHFSDAGAGFGLFMGGDSTTCSKIKMSEKKQRHRERCLLFRRSKFREGEQQRVTLPFNQLFSDSEDAHITTRLAFQPACFTATHLPKHAPAPYFRSTTLHCNYSTSKNSLHYRPMTFPDQRFRCVFICQMDVHA